MVFIGPRALIVNYYGYSIYLDLDSGRFFVDDPSFRGSDGYYTSRETLLNIKRQIELRFRLTSQNYRSSQVLIMEYRFFEIYLDNMSGLFYAIASYGQTDSRETLKNIKLLIDRKMDLGWFHR